MKKPSLPSLVILGGLLLAVCFFAESRPAVAEDTEKPALTRMLYNNPGLLDDLAVGLWSWPIPTDFNGDGQTDLIVNCECVPYNGTWRFENKGVSEDSPGYGTAAQSSELVPNPFAPVFKRGERISGGEINVEPSYVDGKLRVLRPGKEYPDYAQTGLVNPIPIPLPENVHPNNVRGNMWKYVDFNGDGLLDIIVGIDDWTPYGWANAYDEKGVWKNAPSLGAIYVALNKGTNEKPEYETPSLLTLGDGSPLATYGWPSPNFADFDGDGDLDLLCGEFIDKFTYFENVGTRTEPKYAEGIFITLEDGSLAKDALCMVTPLAFDWTQDGKPDILCGNEDGRISFYENTGTFCRKKAKIGGAATAVNIPVFKSPIYFQQEAYELKAGSLSTPSCADLDGDGAIDIISGDSEGCVLFFKNLSPPGEEFPKWARPIYIQAGGKVIRRIAGPNGSIQGPIEEKYGYSTLTVADWDNDGLLDLMVSDVLGKPVWFKNIGTKTEFAFAEEKPVEVEWEGEEPRLAWGWMKPNGKELLTQWRTTPVMFDWNGDGLTDLCILDQEGYFAFFERFHDADGNLKLKAPQRIFCDKDGNPLRLNDQTAGASGRRKICIADWDNDGRPDLIVNSVNAAIYKNVKTENGKTFFENLGDVASTRLAGHTTSPTTADFNADSFPDLVIGAEDGRFYYLRNPHSK